MRSVTRRSLRPCLERLENREVRSSLVYLVAVQRHDAMMNHITQGLKQLTLKPPQFLTPPTNATGVANPLLTPTGVPTAAESRRETYHATFAGQYSIGPGRFSTEAGNFYFRGAGRTNQVLHSDSQMRVIRPVDSTQPSTGEISLFDRNINNNSDLGFDIYANPQDVDRLGRPTHLTIYTIDVNVSSGNYVEGIARGTIDIHYGPVPHSKYFKPAQGSIPGILNHGTATIVINAQLYGIGTTFSLKNADINP